MVWFQCDQNSPQGLPMAAFHPPFHSCGTREGREAGHLHQGHKLCMLINIIANIIITRINSETPCPLPQEHDWIIPAGFSLCCWIFWSTIAVHREKKLISRQSWLMFACGRLLRGHIAPSPRTRAWKDPEMTVSRHRGRHWREIKVDKAGLLKFKGLLNQYYIRGRQGDSHYDEHSRVKQNTSICAMSRYEPGTIQSLGRSIALPSFGSKRFGPS